MGQSRRSAPRRIRDWALAGVAAATAAAAIATVDDRVPAQLTRGLHGLWPGEAAAVGTRLFDLTGASTLDNVFLVAMLAAAVVLVVLMVRT